MICYQDEKMYGPAPDYTTSEELDAQIYKLEMELYGHPLEDKAEGIKPKIYDVSQKKLVDVTIG